MTVTEAQEMIDLMKAGRSLTITHVLDKSRLRSTMLFWSMLDDELLMVMHNDWITRQYRIWVGEDEIGNPEWN